MPHVPPGLRAATQDLVPPLGRDGVHAIDCAKEGSGNRSIRVGVAAAHHGVYHTLLQTRGMEKVPQSILKRDEHPTLLRNVIGRGTCARINDGLHQRSLDLHLRCPLLDFLVDFARVFP